MRLLQCRDCRSVETLPDVPRGVDPHNIQPGQDPLLDELLKRHHFPNGEPHVGNLVAVEKDQWENEEIREQILKGLGSTSKPGMGDEFYDLRSTFHEDALKCFSQHGRPERCIDWCDDRKLLGRPTEAGQRYQDEHYKDKSTQVYLCHFCPVSSRVMVEQRAARGDYK